MSAHHHEGASRRSRRFRKLDCLGKGSYGAVFRAVDLHDPERRVVAVKRIGLESLAEGLPAWAIREVSLHRSLNHPNVVRLLDVLYVNLKLTLVMECCQTDVKKYLQRCSGLVPRQRLKSIVGQLLEAVAYLHSRNIIHRDLKPANLLLAEDGTLKLADFGLARAFRLPFEGKSTLVVTRWYRDPSVLLGWTEYGKEIDMWAVGCIFAELAYGKALFPGQSDENQLTTIFRTLGTPSEESWPGVTSLPKWKEDMPVFKAKALNRVVAGLPATGLELLAGMLRYDPELRTTAQEALEHEYLAKPTAAAAAAAAPASSASCATTTTVAATATAAVACAADAVPAAKQEIPDHLGTAEPVA